MDTFNLLEAARQDPLLSKSLIGVMPCNQVPSYIPPGYCVIANTMPADHNGQHWVCFFATSTDLIYFDSYGFEPNKCFKLKPTLMNKEIFQSTGSDVCGQFCLMVLYMLAHRQKFSTIMRMFSKNLRRNDRLVCRFARQVLRAKVHTIKNGQTSTFKDC